MEPEIFLSIFVGIFFIIGGLISIFKYKEYASLAWPLVKSRGKLFSERFVVLMGVIFLFVGISFLLIGGISIVLIW